MKIILLFSLFFGSLAVHSQAQPEKSKMLSEVYTLYTSGRFQTSLDKLKEIESTLGQGQDSATKGLIAYWKGLINVRLQEFPDAITSFQEAIRLNYIAKDLYYEYGLCFREIGRSSECF
jgi:tetratricopeptide (TPR) repeat protein